MLCGRLPVWEDRTARRGRRISLNVVVLRAMVKNPRPDPVFWIAGGPGQAATSLARGLARSWMRRDRDIVLVDQRGTGGSNRLDCAPSGDRDDPQALGARDLEVGLHGGPSAPVGPGIMPALASDPVEFPPAGTSRAAST